jgi:hypothetical protein
MDIIHRIDALLANTPTAEIEEFEVTRCLRDCRDEIIAGRACAEMMLQGTGQPLAERLAKRVLDDITDTFAGVPRWIEVYESLPPEGQLVMWLRPAANEWPIVCGKRDGNSINWGGDFGIGIEPFVTHWMPLPEPPAD